LANPLYSLHFGAFFIGAGGIGSLVGSLWGGLASLVLGLFTLAGAAAIYGGLRLCMRVYRFKLVDAPVE
jgi:hypothetical protein